jgi:hypothetical protein
MIHIRYVHLPTATPVVSARDENTTVLLIDPDLPGPERRKAVRAALHTEHKSRVAALGVVMLAEARRHPVGAPIAAIATVGALAAGIASGVTGAHPHQARRRPPEASAPTVVPTETPSPPPSVAVPTPTGPMPSTSPLTPSGTVSGPAVVPASYLGPRPTPGGGLSAVPTPGGAAPTSAAPVPRPRPTPPAPSGSPPPTPLPSPSPTSVPPPSPPPTPAPSPVCTLQLDLGRLVDVCVLPTR